MRFLLDTCVIAEFVARQPDPGVVRWIDSIDEERLYLSAITIGEIKKGIEKLPDSRRRSELTKWLEDELLMRFKNKILPLALGSALHTYLVDGLETIAKYGNCWDAACVT